MEKVPRLKVITVIPGGGSGGSMVFAKRQDSALSELGADIRQFFLSSRVNPIRLLSEWVRFRKEINKFKPDVIYCHYGTVTAFFAASATSLPIVVVFRGGDINPRYGGNRVRAFFARFLSLCAALKAKQVICVSNEIAARLPHFSYKIQVLPTGVSSTFFAPCSQNDSRAKLGWEHNNPVVLFNAGLAPAIKRLDLAMRAVDEARKVNPDIRLFVLDGNIPPDEMPIYHNAADVLLVTSDSEGSPTIVQEAIACGLPVVSVPVGDVSIRTQKVFPSKIVPKDSAKIAGAILDMVSLRQRSNGPDIAAKEFDDRVVAGKVLEILLCAANLGACAEGRP